MTKSKITTLVEGDARIHTSNASCEYGQSQHIKKSTWRWAGYYNLSVDVVALEVLYATLRDLPIPPGAAKRKTHKLDYIGTVLWMGGSEHP
ncbi:hypothetical protein EV178_000029 [Coemansia sp. RSA 1646]|nr:hypothetical protein EV178_000029 [Coemansia sp. RSA 1646]